MPRRFTRCCCCSLKEGISLLASFETLLLFILFIPITLVEMDQSPNPKTRFYMLITLYLTLPFCIFPLVVAYFIMAFYTKPYCLIVRIVYEKTRLICGIILPQIFGFLQICVTFWSINKNYTLEDCNSRPAGTYTRNHFREYQDAFERGEVKQKYRTYDQFVHNGRSREYCANEFVSLTAFGMSLWFLFNLIMWALAQSFKMEAEEELVNQEKHNSVRAAKQLAVANRNFKSEGQKY